MFDIDGAKIEVQEKLETKIEEETAYKWASRAIACYELFSENSKLEWYLRAEDYRHEALEHAALSSPELFKVISDEIVKHRLKDL